jgi:hypothetical protein
MSLSYVSNSDTLNFVERIGGDLDLLFQALWKHVLCIEFIRLRWSVENEEASRSFAGRLYDLFRQDARKKKSLEYLRDWEGKFWVAMDQNIKEITERYERKLEGELGSEIHKFKARGQYDKQLSLERKSELVARARKIINADQLVELNGVIDILADQSASAEMKKYYILIDKLDERWVDVSIRFRLIRAPVESLKTFRKIHNLKILVAIRSDILERVIQETGDLTFQREKFEDLFVRLKWTKGQLKELVEKRIGHLFRHQYTIDGVSFESIFHHRIGGAEPFDYIAEHTLMRPRDVITFVNECFEKSEGHYQINAASVRKAEVEYSRLRRSALEYEWQSAFPQLPLLLDFLASKGKPIIEFTELHDKDSVDELSYAICAKPQKDHDPIYQSAAFGFNSADGGHVQFLKEVVCVLYRVGAIGIKLRPGEGFLYSHRDDPLLDPSMIHEQTRVQVHEMLHASMRLKGAEARLSAP